MIHKPVLLWLDDERDPAEPRWQSFFPVDDPQVIWVQSYVEFVSWIEEHALPNAVCFDHDLGDGLSGMDAARWLTEFCMENRVSLPTWNVHSANPIGKENIKSLLSSFDRVFPNSETDEG